MPSIFTTTLAALAVAPFVTGHSWVEQLRNVNSKGTYVGDYGYPRGYVGKSDPGFTGDSMNWLLPVAPKVFIDETSPLCHTAQTTQKQSSEKYPRLKAVAGGFVAMRYSENGHVTLVDPKTGEGKPEKGGTVFVYGTTEPKEDEKLMDVLRWTKNGTSRGTLLATNNFDDERCYEINATPISKERQAAFPNYAMGQATDGGAGGFPLMCDTNVQIPTTAPSGKPYTLYWVWQWNTAKGTEGQPTGKDQYYTTCIDVDVTSADQALSASAESKYALGQQDAMSEAVKDFNSRTAIITNPVQGEVGPIFGSGNSSSKPSATPTAPALSQITNIPTMTSSPEPSSGAGDAVTVTDIVYVTVTAGASSMPVATASAPASGFVTSAKPSASGAPSAPAAGVSSAATPAVPSAAPSAGVSSGAIPAVPSAAPTGMTTSAAASASAPASAPTQAPAGSGALGGFTMPKPSGAAAAKRAIKIRGMAWN
ncbi:hypothetical protein B5807_02446 [Epicoccum nigrum]|jgi:hypothetical protein|uniref:DUF7492 domain-containing protein n=1 Tax=Epicoccum nigrum TaxID=105696 RepID=A0A1Y2M9R7_EPING|nr:hypothetical protein B5807_02446 [Epicoccum nigrum]